MAQDWTAAVAGERMKLDGEFAERVTTSSLTPQQWDLVMTATDFEIENPTTPGQARIVANTDNLSAVENELDRIQQASPAGGPSGGPGSSEGGGLLSRVFGAFGGERGNASAERRNEAQSLTDEYAKRLQERLVEQDRWEEVCRMAAGG